MATITCVKTEDGNQWHIVAEIAESEAEIGGSLTGVNFYACNGDVFGSGCVSLGSYVPGQTEYIYDAYYAYFSEGDEVFLYKSNGEAPSSFASTTAEPFGGGGGDPPPDPTGTPLTGWAVTSGIIPLDDSPQVTGFAFHADGTSLYFQWNKFAGAASYQLQYRAPDGEVFLPLAAPSQLVADLQELTIDYTSDARFFGGQLYVFRLRALG